LRKIGILTYHHPENRNYGAMLQLFALYTTIQNLGHESVVIQYDFFKNINRRKKFKQKIKNWIIYHLSIRPFKKFSDQYLINKTKKVDENNISALNEDFDLFVVGSDQVWRYNYVPSIKTFFLDFVSEKIPKVAYAASFGVDQWNEAPKNITEEISRLIKRFSSVSVRESSGLKICNNFGVNATLVLDPVFLISINIYNSLIDKSESIQSRRNYIAKMLLDSNDSVEEEIGRLAKNQKKRIVDLNGSSIPFIHGISKRKFSISEWLSLIKNSDLVITDSYHCIAFSIIYNKNFIYLGNKDRGNTRLESLWILLGINRQALQNPSFHDLLGESKIQINYDKVNTNLLEAKRNSMNFLKAALKSVEK
jgi:hypothetical protein